MLRELGGGGIGYAQLVLSTGRRAGNVRRDPRLATPERHPLTAADPATSPPDHASTTTYTFGTSLGQS